MLKGLKMVACELWRSEARRVLPLSKTLYERVQGRSQGITLSASDLYNVQADILNPFYNMDQKVTKKLRQNKTWIEGDIPCINLSQSVQCTRPSHCRRQQWRHNPIQIHDVTIAQQRT